MASSKNSVITTARRVNLAKITRGAVATIPAITHIAFGDQGIDEDGQPLMPTGDQQALHHEVGRYGIDSVANPPLDGEGMAPDMQVDMAGQGLAAGRAALGVETTNRYTVTIPGDDLNGINISEMALIDADGVFAAVKNFLPKGKDQDVTFTFQFDDEF